MDSQPFVVRKIHSQRASNGKEYWNLTLADKTGEIYAKVWADNLASCDQVTGGDVVLVYGTVSEYKERKQIIIAKMIKSDEFDMSDFIEKSQKDTAAMFDFIEQAISAIENKFVKKLVQSFFTDQNFIERFKSAPGAQKIHHAYVGGLLEHTYEMLKFAQCVEAEYPVINKDLLTAGALLHDIGKMEELAVSSDIERTVKGKLIGHLTIGALTIAKKMDAIKNFPEHLKNKILNLILGHHGKLEFGSPVKPMLLESQVLYRIDELSSKTNTAAREYELGLPTSEDFSEKNFALDTEIYIRNDDDNHTQVKLI